MVKPGIAEKLEAWTQAGGTFVTTFFSGMVDENDLVYLGGYPGPLRKLLGIWAEEIDALTPGQTNAVIVRGAVRGAARALTPCRLLCDRIHAGGRAKSWRPTARISTRGEPAVTVNTFGAGRARTTWRRPWSRTR